MTASLNIWPLTIVKDRYQGTYSGGAWLAWHCLPWEIPREVFGQDVPCGSWWGDYDPAEARVGRGETVEDAIIDLSSWITATGKSRGLALDI